MQILFNKMGDIFEDENETALTIDEYIESVDAQELEADLVLGGDEGKECTYPNGYMNRQAVFSCLTCVPPGNAGVCTACSLTCHEGHEVVELWTRRRFRCDCGNSKFGSISCKLIPDKDSENHNNSYNQNYKGLYCTCHRPYPDPNGETQGEMIQCCICEDWFHEKHLGFQAREQIPKDDEGEPMYEDFICQNCASRCSFLYFYQESFILPSANGGTSTNIEHTKQYLQEENCIENDAEKGRLEIVLNAEEIVNSQLPNPSIDIAKDDNQLNKPTTLISENDYVGDHLKQQTCAVHERNHSSPGAANPIADSGEALPPVAHASDINSSEGSGIVNEMATCSEAERPTAKEISFPGQSIFNSTFPSDLVISGENSGDQEPLCKLRSKGDIPLHRMDTKKPLFMGSNWRERLCRCKCCSDLFREKGVAFLLDKSDTLDEYEKIAQRRREEKLQQQEGVQAAFLQNLGHVQQIELMTGINDMKNELRSFLESLDTSKVVTGEDIREVFDNLKRKRRRLD